MDKLKIKISDIQHLTDARYFSSRQVEYLGFNRLTTASNDIKLIQEWIYGPQIVSEFIGNNCLIDIQNLLEEHQTEVIHFDYFVDKATLEEFTDYEIFFDVDIQIETIEKVKRKMEILADSVDFFVIKSSFPFEQNLNILKDLCAAFPCFIDMKIMPNDIRLIKKIGVEGIVLRGGDEERVGVKSFEQLDEIFDVLENDSITN